jgi:major membrane immunogen (membrane-anchored lipoprotein)
VLYKTDQQRQGAGIEMRLERSGAIAATAVACLLVVGACSSNDKTSTSSSTGTTESSSQAPEDVKAPASEVAAGLKQIQTITAQTAQAVGSDQAKAADLNEQIEPVWQHIEGTVKSNDAESYITFEDAFAALGKAVDSGDTAKAQEQATAVAAAVATYLAKYPG